MKIDIIKVVLKKMIAYDLAIAAMSKEAQNYEYAIMEAVKLHATIEKELTKDLPMCRCGHPFLFHTETGCRGCYRSQAERGCNGYLGDRNE